MQYHKDEIDLIFDVLTEVCRKQTHKATEATPVQPEGLGALERNDQVEG